MKHKFENDNGDLLFEYENVKNNKEEIKAKIIEYINNNPSDTIYHLINGDYSQFYSMNPKNNKPSLEIIKNGCSTYYKALELK